MPTDTVFVRRLSCREIGNFLQPTFGPPTWWCRDRFFERSVIKDEEKLAAILSTFDQKYGLRVNPV